MAPPPHSPPHPCQHWQLYCALQSHFQVNPFFFFYLWRTHFLLQMTKLPEHLSPGLALGPFSLGHQLVNISNKVFYVGLSFRNVSNPLLSKFIFWIYGSLSLSFLGCFLIYYNTHFKHLIKQYGSDGHEWCSIGVKVVIRMYILDGGVAKRFSITFSLIWRNNNKNRSSRGGDKYTG